MGEPPVDKGKGRWRVKARPKEWVDLFDMGAKGCILCLQCLEMISEDLG